VISRYIVIALALGVALFQASRGNYVESTGLFGLAIGLGLLRFAPKNAPYRRFAYVFFAITAVAVGFVLYRRY
jgi:hypothetical protein